MEDRKGSKIKGVLKKIFGIIYNLIIILCVLLIIIIFIQRVWDNEKSFAGYRFFTVISGSMVPKYDIGEVVICKETQPEELKVGDSIVYKGKEGVIDGKRILHEIVEIKDLENGKKVISAKGITNNVVDPEILEDDIYGVVKYKSRLLTFLYFLATKKITSFVVIIILVLNVFISFKSGKKEEYENALGEAKKDNEEITKKDQNEQITDKIEDIEKEEIEDKEERKDKNLNDRLKIDSDIGSKKEIETEKIEEEIEEIETEEIKIDKKDKKIKITKMKS